MWAAVSRAAPQRNRASFAQATLREVEALDPSVRDRILARTSPATSSAGAGKAGSTSAAWMGRSRWRGSIWSGAIVISC